MLNASADRSRIRGGFSFAASSEYPKHPARTPHAEPPMSCRLAVLMLMLVVVSAPADEPKEQTVEQLAERCRKSVVVITTGGRGGKRHGLRTGFVLTPDRGIATNPHVLCGGRGITGELPHGSKKKGIGNHATDPGAHVRILRMCAR